MMTVRRRVLGGWIVCAWPLLALACGSNAGGGASETGGNNGAGASGGTPGGGSGGAPAVDASAGGTAGTSPDGGGSPGPVNDPKFTAFCGAARDEIIRRYDRCEGISPDAAKALVNNDVCKWWGAAVSGGRMAFDGAGADACIAALKAMPCDADALPPICDRALWGTLDPGARCSMVAQQQHFSECETGTTCVGGMGSGCEGKCVKQALLMQPCGFGTPCVSGESCSIKTGTCALKGGLGSTCGFNSAACQVGLYCTDLFASGTCMQRQAVGTACSQFDQCTPPAVCAKEGLTGTCKVPPRPGDACSPDEFTCGLGFMYCGADMKCHPQAGIGQPCGVKDGVEIPCAVGTCNGSLSTPVCEKSAALAGCLLDAECGPDALCTLQNFSLTCTATCTPW
jgi:hypothetical protein